MLIIKSEYRIYLLITLVSMIILISDMNLAFASPLIVLLSLPMLKLPVSFVPMLFVTSWNMTFSIFGLGAYFYYYIMFLISMIFSNRDYGKFVGLNRIAFIYILFAVYIIYGAVYSISHVTGPAIRLMFTVLSVAFVGLFRCRNHNYIYVSIFWIALISSIFFGLRMVISPEMFIIEREELESFSIIRPTIMRDLNFNSAAQIITILSIVLIISAIRIKRYKVLISFALFMNLYTLLTLASRTSFYALFISFIFYLFFASNINKYRKFLFILLAVGGLYLLNQYIDNIESRLLVTSLAEDEGNGRFITWAQLWEDVVPKYWLKGIGFGRDNYSLLYYDFDADNLYIDLLCQLGVIGSAIFYLLHFNMMRRVNSIRKDNIGMESVFFILFCFLIFGLGESVFDTPLYWASILLAYSLLPNMECNNNRLSRITK